MDEAILHPQIKCLNTAQRDFADDRAMFGVVKSIECYWTACRETPANYLIKEHGQKTHRIYFTFLRPHYNVPASVGYQEVFMRMARWIHLLESKMGWWDRTRIHTTQHENVAHVWVSGGWFQGKVALSLFANLLWAGPFYEEGRSVEDVLMSNSYLSRTLPAVYRFLDGHQHCLRYRNTYWYRAFGGRSEQRCKELLIKRSVIEERARQLWEREGRIPDRDWFYWTRACDLLDREATKAQVGERTQTTTQSIQQGDRYA